MVDNDRPLTRQEKRVLAREQRRAAQRRAAQRAATFALQAEAKVVAASPPKAINTIVWAFGFPLLLALVGLGIGLAFAMTDSESLGFVIAKVCFSAAAFDVVAVAIYWAITTSQPTPWNALVPTTTAVVVVPVLVLSLQWLGNIEAQLSTRLYPGNEPTPVLPFAADIPKDALRVVLGTNLAWTTKWPQTILKMAKEKMIEIDKVPGKTELVVSTLKIFDDRNDIIARLDSESGFWVANSVRKKRPNPSTLIVYDRSDIEVLRIVFLNPTTLSVTGIFRHAGIPRPVIVTQDYMDMGRLRGSQSIMGGAADSVINVE
jgi:hypothetical protein